MSSHLIYHICQSIANCHFVSCVCRSGCTVQCQGAGMQYHRREWTHTVMSSIAKLM